ncbi:hypothetical protein BG006_008968 [Podila minutissima]|uniref:Transmembrane protein n=1 Tax=Podila minutissima TaxID=64525 RepID=A0A9P5SQV7_9FUNG|nr:hypothetical protein BG006_008968 [Podila minutissima]
MTPEYHHVDIPDSPVEPKPHLPLLPKNGAAPPSPTSTRPTPRKPWMILSLPLAIALVFTAGMCCLSVAKIKSALQSLEHLTMASASWPIMPLTSEEQTGPQQQLQQPSPFSVQQASESIVQKEGARSSLFAEDGCGDEEEDGEEGEYDNDEDEEEDEDEDDEEEESIEQSFQALEIITVEKGNLVKIVVVEEELLSVQDLVQFTTANAPVSNPVTLFRRRDQGDDQEDDETEDEDRQDLFPSKMNDDEASAQDEEEQREEEEEDKTSTSTSPIEDTEEEEPRHNHHQDQNTNLGGTGGNGPILLCSSRVCLPSLRDSILAKLSVQIRHVMDHLRNGQVMVQRMDTTAPFTKDLLVSSQSDLVQQLEEQIIKDLKDWVMGIKHSSTSSGNAINPHKKTPLFSTADAPSTESQKSNNNNNEGEDSEMDEATEISVEAETVFLGGEEEEGLGQEVTTSSVSTPGNDNEPEFRMVGLDLEDDDDDDEDHEYDIIKTPSKSKKKKTSSSRLRRRASSAREYFLSADKLLMQQEWSRWIAHWVHHAKLLVLSHTLATRTLNSMNQLAITDDNVPLADQRHWSWNLDKALATVMVASEMLCGGPTDPKDAEQFLQALSMPVTISSSSSSSSSSSGATPKIMTLTANAQKCIEAWKPDLEEILKKTATTTA